MDDEDDHRPCFDGTKKEPGIHRPFFSHQKLYIIYPIVLLLFFKPLKKAHKMVEKAKLCW
jgi:hypothetical protein